MDAREDMKNRLDPLIHERAPWLFSGRWHHELARQALMWLLRYPRTVELGAEYRDLPMDEVMRRVAQLIVRDLTVEGLEHIPATGPALIVSNHPTGIADGIVLSALVSAVRDDLFIYANHDIMRILPQSSSLIAPVEWRVEKRSHSKTRATMDYTREALDRGRIGLIFPSGRLAKRRGLALHERPWMASAAMIAKKFDVPVIPLRIRARNSVLFYLLDAIHPTVRDVTLFNEVLNKTGQPFRVTIGAPIPPSALPARSEDGIALLRDTVLALPAPGEGAVKLSQLRRLSQGRHAVVTPRPIE
ncbi:1-acyl-sn-glycerol-3-phosphate acyltransferase [Paracoccus yeei]|mgnify:FL=1|jgi:putative hemolysin|uniref:Glycerol acyltransferase n=2 Tax=Paracoccus yeei TaxID=147645 RepID=A0A2D2C3N5_9RHOB|nr:1-acyl-sn-glycerol-3-phosphate acyltransferase [Paracoccus yeei]ATQ57117.1 glycerol acyltransferase [Paracoccus yeei]MBY0136832.1 1-acyl-sn-glycerol-3-phosphate acyltransferase [Paracoccus yeei]OWJ93526.1 glycerol acyltransferase [Paracoccus yeei]QEU09019.1 glycerol acyltransferase [Paracoccus yeei]